MVEASGFRVQGRVVGPPGWRLTVKKSRMLLPVLGRASAPGDSPSSPCPDCCQAVMFTWICGGGGDGGVRYSGGMQGCWISCSRSMEI